MQPVLHIQETNVVPRVPLNYTPLPILSSLPVHPTQLLNLLPATLGSHGLEGRTRATSPSYSNFRLIIGPSSGQSFQAKRTGAVANPNAKSAFVGFPKIVDGAV